MLYIKNYCIVLSYYISFFFILVCFVQNIIYFKYIYHKYENTEIQFSYCNAFYWQCDDNVCVCVCVADDSATCKLLLGMLLSLSQQMKSLPSVVRYMAQDIHSQLGDIDPVTYLHQSHVSVQPLKKHASRLCKQGRNVGHSWSFRPSYWFGPT